MSPSEERASPRGLAIFDLDGTLFHAGGASVAAAWEVCDSAGIARPGAEEIRSQFGKPIHEFRSWFRSLAPGRVTAAALEAYDRRELELVPAEGRLYKGVLETLEELEARSIRMAICSNGRNPYVATALDTTGIARFFGAVRIRESEEENKTAMVRELIERAGVRPVVVVGDRRDDIEAARGNGARSVGAAYGFGAPGEIDGADVVVRSAREIPGAIGRLLR